MPLVPTRFYVTGEYPARSNVTVTFVWDPPQGMGPEVIVDYYLVSISPRPLSHPIVNRVYSSPWNVTVDYNTVYTANITAVNCVGQSANVSSLQHIRYLGKPDSYILPALLLTKFVISSERGRASL